MATVTRETQVQEVVSAVTIVLSRTEATRVRAAVNNSNVLGDDGVRLDGQIDMALAL